MLFTLSKYYKYGLLTDDLPKDSPVMQEALRRLPKEVFQERQFRLSRAISINANKGVLPEADWLKPEDDVSYLKPFLQQVVFAKFFLISLILIYLLNLFHLQQTLYHSKQLIYNY